jgi:phosphatidylinositol alpha-1,6-mannosyltransferase
VNEERVDVVVFGAALPLALIAGAVRRRSNAAVLTFTHGVEPAAAVVPGGSVLLRYIARQSTMMTAVSRWAEDRIRSMVGTKPRIEQLPSGIDEDRFHPAVSGEQIRERYALGEGPVIVCVSRLVARKGHDRMIAALPEIARHFPNVRLLIVGTGRGRRRLEALSRRCGVGAHVVFAGTARDDDLPACFAAGDVFAMPCRSRWGDLNVEALGAVFLQAAAVGRPSLAGRSGGAPEAVLDGVTGLVIDAETVAAVEAGLLRLLRSPVEARSFGEKGALRVHTDLRWSQLARRLESLLYDASAARQSVMKTIQPRARLLSRG